MCAQSHASYHEYKVKQEKLHQAWLERKEEREEKLARGEKVGPEERDPTAEQEVTLLGFLKFLVYLLLIVTLAGKFFTGSFLWEYDGKWARLKTYWPVSAPYSLSLFLSGIFAVLSHSRGSWGSPHVVIGAQRPPVLGVLPDHVRWGGRQQALVHRGRGVHV